MESKANRKTSVAIKVGIALAVIGVVFGIVFGVLMGMTKEYILYSSDLGKEYVITRSMIAHINCKLRYGGSLKTEYLANGDTRSLVDISPDFERVISDIKANSVTKIESRIHFISKADKLFEYVEGKNGKVTKADINERILTAIDTKTPLSDIYSIDKAMTLEEMQEHTTLLSSFTTSYASSGAPRRENIRLATQYLNGSIVEPYARLSFNEVVGDRTAERGFKEAKVIQDGKYIKGYGGGVCQVSTTLYNAWVLAGGDIYYASAHSLPPHYVDLSRDAMVSSYNDLILTNNSETTLYVRAFCGIDDVTFEIYGLKNKYKYDIVSVVTHELPIGETIVGEVNEGEEYEEMILSYGAPGYRSEAYLVKYGEDGNEVDRQLLREDVYKCQDKVIKRIKKDS